jgi:hypothetical protein
LSLMQQGSPIRKAGSKPLLLSSIFGLG